MVYLSPYETLIIVVVFLAITLGPPAAGAAVAFVRGLRRPPGDRGQR